MSITREAKKEVERFLREGRKIAAVKYLTETYGFSLTQAKTLVEAVEQYRETLPADGTSAAGRPAADEVLRAEVKSLLASGKKIEAIKMAKETLGVRLKGAKLWVEDTEREMDPHYRPHPVKALGSGIVVLFVFITLGVLFMGGATYIYYRQFQSIEQSDLIKGKVVSMRENGDGLSAPVIEYEWQGKKWVYASKTYSSPPSFTVDEEVPVYVNRQQPDDVTVDTFSERWLLILILGGLGFFFVGIPLMVVYFTTRR